MQRKIDHPGWDRSWSVPTHHTIDDLGELGFLRIEPSADKRRSFVLSMKGRSEADLLAREISRGNPSTGPAPAPDEVLQWLVALHQAAPEGFTEPISIIDRAVADGMIDVSGRSSFGTRVLDLLDDGYLRGDVPDWDQASPEQRLRRTTNLRLTMRAHQAAPRQAPAAAALTDGAHSVMPIRDVFLSHAGPDKDDVARPLAEQLQARGFTVWFDEFELVVGDRLSSSIDRGLSAARSGVVILSQDFFRRPWTERELSGLVARETATGEQLVLPVWHGVSRDDVLRFSPPLADLFAVSTADGLDAVANALAPAIVRRRGQEQLSGRTLSAADVVANDERSAESIDDERLFEFDPSRLSDFDVARAHRFLAEHGDVYRTQLVMALWLDGWRERMGDHDWGETPPAEAFDYAMREVAAHLRQGDFLPTGLFFRETSAGEEP